MDFYKLHGAGNSFVFVDLRSSHSRKQFQSLFRGMTRKNLAKSVCNPFYGIGADGFAIFDKPTSKDHNVRWDFYNADGSKAEMCGNAARCAGLFLSGGRPWKNYRLKTGAGVVGISFRSEDCVFVEMRPPKNVKAHHKLKVSGKDVVFTFVNTGVPHAVIKVSNFQINDQNRKLAGQLQKHRYFGKPSTNVTFYSEKKLGHIVSASFERGIFDFTKACGTGAVAAAVAYHLAHPKVKKVHVQVPGGKLVVDLNGGKPVLMGPARWIAQFKVDADSLKDAHGF